MPLQFLVLKFGHPQNSLPRFCSFWAVLISIAPQTGQGGFYCVAGLPSTPWRGEMVKLINTN